MLNSAYDAVLVLSFGGPEGPDEVAPFLENVLRGKNVPRERMLEVAAHYQQFGGVSPINEQNRQLIVQLRPSLAAAGIDLPVYWGNRNWHPLLPDTLRRMRDDGVRRAIAFVTSAFSCYSGCRQYREDIQRARQEIGPGAPEVDKIRVFYNHPGFIEAQAERIREATAAWSAEEFADSRLMFSAHSIPVAMAATCDYEAQLGEACRLVAERVGHRNWWLVYQSRSGPPTQPWLEPDIGVAIRQEVECNSIGRLVITPIGFVSDHMEVLFDLDTEAAALCDRLGIRWARVGTVGLHPEFVETVTELIAERVLAGAPVRSIGRFGPYPHVCPPNCCAYTPQRPAAAGGTA